MKTYDQRSGGCGCGGGGGCAGGCGAAHGTTPANGVRDGFVRPRFFAGQLLTEDDLQALVDYQVGKRRLTNRMLFGAGVTAGLQVWCDPCNPRQVQVQPGHAIDGFGNDLYLACPQAVDVVTLARAISGDGCAPGTESAERLQPRTYALRLHYTETAEDPVVPHIVDDGCATSAPLPEATRIREGVRFALSCDPSDCGETPPPDPRAVRLAALLPDIATLQQVRRDTKAIVDAFSAADYQEVSDALSRALASGGFGDWLRLAGLDPVPRYPTTPLSNDEGDLLATDPNTADAGAVDRLAAALSRHLSTWYAIWIASRGDRMAPAPATLGPQVLTAIYDRLVAVGGAARQWSAAEAAWPQPISLLDGARLAFHKALADLARHFVNVLQECIALDPQPPLDPEQEPPLVPDKAAQALLFLDELSEEDYLGNDAQAFQLNAAIALSGLHLATSETLHHWRQYLARNIDRFTCGGRLAALARCHHLAGLTATSVSPIPRVRPTNTIVRELLDATTALNSAINTLLADAVCEANLTPMPSPTPTGVLLARVTIGDCRVTEICAAGRPQIDGPYARRMTDRSTSRREHALCRECCHPTRTDDSLINAARRVQQGESELLEAVPPPEGDPPGQETDVPEETDALEEIEVPEETDAPEETEANNEAGEGADGGADDGTEEDRIGGGATVGDFVGPRAPDPFRPGLPNAPLPPLPARVDADPIAMPIARRGDVLPEPTPPASTPARPTWHPKMRKAELTAIAESAGLAVSESDTKATIVAALEAHDRKE